MAAGMTTPTMTPDTLKTTACCRVDATLADVNGEALNAVLLKDENGKSHGSQDVDKHFFVLNADASSGEQMHTIPLSFRLVLRGAITSLTFGNPGSTERILFLPYYVNNITSTVIPIRDPSVCYFTTENLSGCNFFIDELPDRNLVCLHANAKKFSPTQAEVDANPAAFNPTAVIEMNKQHSTALQYPPYHGATHKCQLRVEDYYAAAKLKVEEKRRLGHEDVKFLGGATVVGFRVGGRWQFWFQTYGQFEYRIPGGKFRKGKVIKLGDEPVQRLEARCFWEQPLVTGLGGAQ